MFSQSVGTVLRMTISHSTFDLIYFLVFIAGYTQENFKGYKLLQYYFLNKLCSVCIQRIVKHGLIFYKSQWCNKKEAVSRCFGIRAFIDLLKSESLD